MAFIVLGIVTALNVIIIFHKFKRKRTEDAIFDSIILVLLVIVFGGSEGSLIIGTIASLCISIYLWASPPKFFSGDKGFFQEFIRRLHVGKK